MYLIFDTETTGLIEKGASFKPLKGFPRIVQIAWNTYSEKGKLMSSNSYLIKPDSFEIPKKAQEVHGISTEEALADGVDSHYVMKLFNNAVEHEQVLIAHNFKFDGRVVMAESIINDLFCPIYNTDVKNRKVTYKRERFDTMIESMELVGKRFPNGALKYPKLDDLFFKLFKTHFDNQHNALADVNATAACYFEMKKLSK